MAMLTDPEFWARLFGICVLNLLLSGDNALVIALAVRALPRRERILGQIWGAGGAVVLRLLFVGIVSLLLRVPFVQFVGGALLGYVAGEMILEDPLVKRTLGDAAPMLHRSVPIAIGLVVTATGWWQSRERPPHVPEEV